MGNGNSPKARAKATRTRQRNAARRRAQRRATPHGRLSDDGRSNPEHIRQRLLWLANELQLPREDLPKIGRCLNEAEVDFAEKHHISFDWLLTGDLRGLQQMIQGRKIRALPFWRHEVLA